MCRSNNADHWSRSLGRGSGRGDRLEIFAGSALSLALCYNNKAVGLGGETDLRFLEGSALSLALCYNNKAVGLGGETDLRFLEGSALSLALCYNNKAVRSVSSSLLQQQGGPLCL
ncbi:hypothetical protein RRG08_014875 [Elysia crispata]|uniref:Uncharacterized protein n=1 Tax=Elysia crispata TaxID=231223 RepID=A0AAE1ANG0_9GAST|nr:hypothetical protein RRG08_014875 [Elysia crispata]